MSFIKHRNWKFWAVAFTLIVFVSIISLAGSKDEYPISQDYINPATGRADSGLKNWVEPITSYDNSTAYIDLGDRAGVANSIESDVLFVLSPILRKNPGCKVFTVGWEMICCTDGSNSDGGQELVYHRDTGQVFYRSRGYAFSKWYDTKTLIGSRITDRIIHELAAKGRGYSDLSK